MSPFVTVWPWTARAAGNQHTHNTKKNNQKEKKKETHKDITSCEDEEIGQELLVSLGKHASREQPSMRLVGGWFGDFVFVFVLFCFVLFFFFFF